MKRVPIIALTFALSLPMVGCAANSVEPSGATFVKTAIFDRVDTMMAEGLRELSSLPSFYPESTESWVDQDAYVVYSGILDRRAERLMEECSSKLQTTALSGYEVVNFHQEETLSDESGTYTVYCWEPAFLTTSHEGISLADGAYFDTSGRLCGYEQFTYFVVKDETGDFPTYRFLSEDLFNGTGEGTASAHALQRIKQAFEPLVRGDWAEDALGDYSNYNEVSVSSEEPVAQVLFSCDCAVKDFKVLGVQAIPTESTVLYSTDDLFDCGELTPDCPLLLNMTFFGTLPYFGVSYADDSGETISYSINMSGMDGSVILGEIVPVMG